MGLRRSLSLPHLLAISQLTLLSICGTVSAQTPFACTGEAFIVQNVNAQLTQVDQSFSPFSFVNIGGPSGREINNLGFRRTDGLLYAIELRSSPSGNRGILRIDRNGTIVSLGSPAGLPTDRRFDSGSISPNGATFYVNRSGIGTLYKVALPALTVTSVAITGAAGFVFDWTVHPTNGLLYGGDQTGAGGKGQLAVLNPSTGVRTDLAVAGCSPVTAACTATSLPAGTAYGGAWFNAAGRLFLYRNSGTIYEIDLTGPRIVSTQTGPGSNRNDAAACFQNVIGVAKQMTATTGGLPATVTIDYVFENLSIVTLSNLSALEDLGAVFGIHGIGTGAGDWEFVSITSFPDAGFRNPAFNGHGSNQLIAGGETLAAAELQNVRVVLTLKTLNAATPDPGGGPARFVNQILFEGDDSGGIRFGDLSTSENDAGGNANPDPDGNGTPDERQPAILTVDQVPVDLLRFEID